MFGERGKRSFSAGQKGLFKPTPTPPRNRPLFLSSMCGMCGMSDILNIVFTFIVIVYTDKSSLCINSQCFSLIFNSLAYAFFDEEADTVTTNSPAKTSPTKGS